MDFNQIKEAAKNYEADMTKFLRVKIRQVRQSLQKLRRERAYRQNRGRNEKTGF